MDVFGMALIELSKADRVTVRQKRGTYTGRCLTQSLLTMSTAAAASESQSKSSNTWVLQSLVPEQYRVPEVIGPSRPAPEDTLNKEDAYVGLYTMAIALVTINGGSLPEGKLERALKRLNANQSTPLGTTERTMATMIKDGYIVRIRETTTDEETVDYIVGPRGKIEVGRAGFAAFVRAIYTASEDEGFDEADLEKRIKRTLDVADVMQAGGGGGGGGGDEDADEAVVPAVVVGRKRGRPRQEAEDE
jgi:hypothetical protein